MKLTHLIADSILQVYEGNNWSGISIAETLRNITVREAIKLTHASPNTIAALTHHLLFWNGVAKQRMNGIEPEIPQTNGFDVPSFTSKQEWQKLIEDTHQSFIDLSKAVSDFPENKLEELTPAGQTTYYKTLQGIAEHAHYHLGQIVILKHIVKDVL